MKELELLRSQRFVVYLALFTVIFLAPTTYFVYHSFSVFISPWREIASAGVALIIAGAIMFFTVRKNKSVALHFALFEVMIAIYYYIYVLGLTWALIPAIGFAIILPYSVSKYTNEIDVQPPMNTLEVLESAVTPLKPQEFDSLKELRADYERRVNEFMDKNPTAKPEEIKG